MNIAFGHTNMDLDCLGSLILIKKLFPDYQLVKSKLVHPAAQNVYTLYRTYFNFVETKELKNETIENVIIVDTSSLDRTHEYFEALQLKDALVQVFDHHDYENCDIPGAVIHGVKTG
jgi:tRNA nucleotidyltransferase (CCA-adding enzyme)